MNENVISAFDVTRHVTDGRKNKLNIMCTVYYEWRLLITHLSNGYPYLGGG